MSGMSIRDFLDRTRHVDNSVLGDSVTSLDTSVSSVGSDPGEPQPKHDVPQHSGRLNPTEKNAFTILLVGETGCGKTAFMSLLANLLYGAGPSELQDYQDPSTQSGLDGTHSQTDEVWIYEFTGPNGRKFQIVDTPGLADTRGLTQDKVHKEAIYDTIKNHVPNLDAIVVMANGTNQRLSVSTNYTLDTVCSMFPRTVLENICFIFTHCDPGYLGFEQNSLKSTFANVPQWVIQNPLGMYKSFMRAQRASSDPRATAKPQRRNKTVDAYEETVETLNDWLKWLDERPVQTTVDFEKLYRISRDIESAVESTLTTLAHLANEREALRSIGADLQDVNKNKSALARLKAQEQELVWDKEPTRTPNTICIAAGCHSNCHAPCKMKLTESNASLGRWCEVFKAYWPLPAWNGTSSVCKTCGHLSTEHRHYQQKHIQRPVRIDLEAKQKLENAISVEEQLQLAQAVTERKLNEIEEELASAQEAIRIYINDFNNLSLSPSFAGHLRSALQMLELRREDLRTKAGSDGELRLVDDSISKLEESLGILVVEEDKLEKVMTYVQNKILG